MGARLYHTERSSEEDDRLLRTMSKSGKSLTLMTARLKRPMSATRARAEDLGLGIAGTEIGKRKRRYAPHALHSPCAIVFVKHSRSLHPMTGEDLLAALAQFGSVLLQALLNRKIVA